MMGLGRAFGGMKMRSRKSSRVVYGLQGGLRHCYYRGIWYVQHCGGVIGLE